MELDTSEVSEAFLSLNTVKSTSTGEDGVLMEKIPIDLDPIGRGCRIAYLIENVLSSEECECLINLSETKGYTRTLSLSQTTVNKTNLNEASAPTLNTCCSSRANEPILCSDLRKSHILILEDEKFSSIVFSRIRHLLPEFFSHGGGLNSKLLEIQSTLWFLKYDSTTGDMFSGHTDPYFIKPDGSARSCVTLHIYLNDDFEGGEMTFLASGAAQKNPDYVNGISVKPKKGMVAVFQHNLFHDSTRVTKGRKYCLKLNLLFEASYKPINKTHDPTFECGGKQKKCSFI